MKASSVSSIASRATQLARQVAPSVTVKPGDTLSAIAKQHNISLQNLLDANPHKKANPDLIHPGEVITIPSSSQLGAPNTATPSHHPADAATNGLTSLDDLIAKILPSTNIGSPTVTVAPQTVTVAKGDTLSAIAQRFGTTTDALRSANGLHPANDRFLPVGKELSLPEGAKEIANKPAAQPIPTGQATVGTGARTVEIAKEHVHTSASELMKSGKLSSMVNNPNHIGVACANFVSAVLIENNLLTPNQHTESVATLKATLQKEGWKAVRLEDAQPGDVVIMQKGISHVEIVVGNKNGNITLIGSNNNKTKEQTITEHTDVWWHKNVTVVLRKP